MVSWSMIDYKKAWSDAHDWEQVFFMSMAPEVLNQSNRFFDSVWLQEWKEYWVEHKRNHVNGCSDIDLERFLTTGERVSEFLDFTKEYDKYIEKYGDHIPTDAMNARIDLKGMYLTQPCEVAYLLEFTNKVRAVICNDFSHEKVNDKNA